MDRRQGVVGEDDPTDLGMPQQIPAFARTEDLQTTAIELHLSSMPRRAHARLGPKVPTRRSLIPQVRPLLL
ncbi:hypothetical protein GCM10009727_19430 [Actinomadura napierensis]|uniref:Uncharacterized protein n=1 Tax=Actinomadura napierensis TaxID=267854 RepID=A0ABN2YK18_9ACTN